jgi:histidinol-phosphatase (PHP family)
VIVDYHMHLRDPAGDIDYTVEAVERFVEVAAERRVDEIGFTEHVYYFRQTRTLWTVPYHVERCNYDLDGYVEAVTEAKERGSPVKLGLEVDYVPDRQAETHALLAPYPWDYLLGSIHFIGEDAVDSEPRLVDAVGIEEAWRLYFELLGEAAASGLFDSLSHPDLVKVFGDRLADFDYGPVAEAIAQSGVAVEVSTGGLRKPIGELYPDPRFLAACRDRDVPVTLASDAHVPALVGSDFARALELLRSAGYETITIFEERDARQVRFDG